MAKIKNFQMKNIKNILGREGYGCSASLYLDGKRIGAYVDYGDGGEESIDYISPKMEEKMMKFIINYAKEHPDKFMIDLYKERPKQFKEECERFKKYHPYISDEDITIETMSANSIVYIVDDFLQLYEKEKIFKKYLKKGYRAISVKGNNITAYPKSWNDEKIKEKIKDEELYLSLDDFNIE